MVLHKAPSSSRLHLNPHEAWALRGPLKLGDEHHKSFRGPGDVLASDHVTGSPLCHALGAECPSGQQFSVMCPVRARG